MYNIKYLLVLLFIGLVVTTSEAHKPFVPEGVSNQPTNNNTTSNNNTLSPRMDCEQSTSQTDLNINNVRARLLGGGDQWWDFDDGRYIVPKVEAGTGLPEVSAIFAGAVWMGGFDAGNNLKMAAQTYRSSTRNDFFPGPLDPSSGGVTEEVCQNWDGHFEVRGPVIEEHLFFYEKAGKDQLEIDEVDVSILGWPGRGNPHFAGIHGFNLPNQDLAPFFDRDGDGLYDPTFGDFPIIEVIGCEAGEAGQVSYADQMIWWVFNDNGGIHTNTIGDPIRMEIQALGFSYKTGDEVNDMTFYRYKMINRANQSIDSVFFAQWVDGDLGCYLDDFIGADVDRGLAILYNDGAIDGAGGCGTVNTYGNEVPVLGVDYFRGPKDENGVELGMSSFVYYVNGGYPGLPGTSDPGTGQEYYNYLSGSWRDGTPFTLGGDGYDPGGVPTKYVFPDEPNNNNGWSMCTETINGADMRTVQASGPFRLDPGAINELIIGVVWVPDVLYPCPSFQTLFTADDLAQALYDNCFDITDGPDAPSMDIVELDKELIVLLNNDTLSFNTNNYQLGYEERGLQIPTEFNGQPNNDTMYVFEGYKVYQLANETFSDLDDPSQARLIFQVDLSNDIDKIYNWTPFPGEVANIPVFTPELKVDGQNRGIRHSFVITEDQFAEGDRALINHTQYHFVALSYAHNEWREWDPALRTGQRDPYLEGRRNVEVTTGIPRIPTPEFGGLTLNAAYGDGAAITRFDGVGNSGNFLDLTEESRNEIVENTSVSEITYLPNRGPIEVKVVDPLRVYPGTYELTIFDENMSNEELDSEVEWMLEDPEGVQWFSEASLEAFNEQLIMTLSENQESISRGISITVGQVRNPGTIPTTSPNGFVGAEAIYADPGNPWYTNSLAPNAAFFGGLLNYVQTAAGDPDNEKDPDGVYNSVLEGTWVPYALTTSNAPANAPYFLTPMWTAPFSAVVKSGLFLRNLNNVDVVLTSDRSKWSRCVVLEAATQAHTNEGWTTSEGNSNMELRNAPSVDRDGNPDNSGTTGMGWFPGYAIDVETGQRLNIFFAENSIYRPAGQGAAGGVGEAFPDLPNTGADMIFNPPSDFIVDPDNSGNVSGLVEILAGEQHYLYVHSTTYDACEEIRTKLASNANGQKVQVYRGITWTSFPMALPETEYLSTADGLIPNDLLMKLRVNSPFEVAEPTVRGDNGGYPKYQFTLDGQVATTNDNETATSALDMINVVPNPYYAYSAYEVQALDNTVKITNLPPECTVTIYSLDGRFIRQYKRAEDTNRRIPAQGVIPEQIRASVQWDLKNSKAIPVASGVYLIHVNAPGLGERVIKWFGIARQFDTSQF